MPILLPTETLSGIWDTYMSVIIPAVAFATISFVITVLSVTIPIEWVSVNDFIKVDTPEIVKLSVSLNAWDVEIYPDIWLGLSHTITTSW